MTGSGGTTDVSPRALALADARRSGTLLDAPLANTLQDIAEADSLRREAERALGWQPVGYKIGATSARIQTQLGAAGPFHSALFAERTQGSGAVIDLPEGTLGLECEIAVRIKGTAARPLRTPAEAAQMIDSIHPAIELVGVRSPGGLVPDVRACIADFGLSIEFVYGDAMAPDAIADLAALPVIARVNGVERATGSGADVLRHPLAAVCYLAQALAAEGKQLHAGNWISTGTCVGIVPVARGDTVEGDFGPLGTVQVTIE